jgi:hypothetical protein
VDEIKLFEELRPAPPPDAPRMREAARARLTAAMSAPPAHLARRRGTVVAGAAAAALVVAGTGYGLTAARGGSSSPRGTAAARGVTSSPRGSAAARGVSSSPRVTAAGLTAVHGCPGEYITAGTLKKVSGTQLIIQPANYRNQQGRTWRARPVTVATSPSTVITRPASGTVSDITNGSQVLVQGTWLGGKLAATQVGIEATPGPAVRRPHASRQVRTLLPKGLGPRVAIGTVVDAHGGAFTVVMHNLISGPRARVQVITAPSTKVLTGVAVRLGRLAIGANLVAVGRIGPHRVLTASAVAESSLVRTMIAGGPVKVRPSGCSASAITTAAVLAGV